MWASVSRQSFDRILELWKAPSVEGEPPRFGWLCTWVRDYPEPNEVKCQIHLRSGNLRPRIELEATDYPLSVQQRNGVTLDWVKAKAASNHLLGAR